MRVLTVDGSLRSSGYCVGDEAALIELAKILTTQAMTLPESLEHIYEEIRRIIRDHLVERVVLESKFIGKNPMTGIDLGRVDAAIMLAAQAEGIPVGTFSPSEIKKAATGKGNANKVAVQQAMIDLYGKHPIVSGRLRPEWIGKGGKNKCDDLADALAIWYSLNIGYVPRSA